MKAAVVVLSCTGVICIGFGASFAGLNNFSAYGIGVAAGGFLANILARSFKEG